MEGELEEDPSLASAQVVQTPHFMDRETEAAQDELEVSQGFSGSNGGGAVSCPDERP